MRFLGTYLILVIVFVFGFVYACAFAVGLTPSYRGRRCVRPEEPDLSNFYPE
jgi:hypothetical protein